MKDFYMYVSSAVTPKHTQNSFTNFTITLPHSIDLKGDKWRVGVCDVTFGKPSTILPDFLLCSDLIQSNFDSTLSLPIMRFIHPGLSDFHESFTQIHYSTVRHKVLDSFNMYLRSVGTEIPSLATAVFFCTLHFKSDG